MKAVEFIIPRDTVRLHFEFGPPVFRMFTVIGERISLEFIVQFASEKGKSISSFEVYCS